VKNRRLRQVKAKDFSKNNSLQQVLEENDNLEIHEGNVFFEQAKGFIINDLDKDFSSAQLAKALAMSVRQMQRMFKEKLDTTPNAFITAVKMEEAAKLLKSSQKNIAEVAYAVGFADPAYFAKVFRKYFNQSPKDYSKPN
jgi:two-component system, response regulator YesN